jgi:CheY-like chemotaxis protein
VYANIYHITIKLSFFIAVLWESGSRMSPPETPSSVSYTAAGALSIAVKDSGVGISAENQLELFQEGRQFNANRLQGGNGSGLGLFITKGVVHLHGGELSSHSDGEGCGTTFTLVLPVVHTDELESEMDSGSIGFAVHPEAMDLEGGRIIRSAGAKDYTELKTEGHIAMQQLADVPGSVTITQVPSGLKDADIRHVMVVDDSTPSRKMLCRLLTNSGYKCVQAADGQECVDVMVRNREMNSSDPKADNLVQIIFMDYEMPIMNGPEACAALRQLAFQIPIFGVTGNVLPSDKEFFIAKGANEVLSKPLCLDELRNLIRKHSSNRGVLLNISRSSSSHSLTRGSSSHALDRSGATLILCNPRPSYDLYSDCARQADRTTSYSLKRLLTSMLRMTGIYRSMCLT